MRYMVKPRYVARVAMLNASTGPRGWDPEQQLLDVVWEAW